MDKNRRFSDIKLADELVRYLEETFVPSNGPPIVTRTWIGFFRRLVRRDVVRVSVDVAVRVAVESARESGIPWLGETAVVDDGARYHVQSNAMSHGMNAWAVVDSVTGEIRSSGFRLR